MTKPAATNNIKAALLADSDLDTETFTVDGIGDVEIRSLTRQQAVKVSDVEGGVEREARILAYGMADPKLSVDEAKQVLQRRSAGQLQHLMERIAKLSGLWEDSEKDARSTFRDDPGD